VTQAHFTDAEYCQAEFTLTFLTYDLFGASNAENGRLLSCECQLLEMCGCSQEKLSSYCIRPSLPSLSGMSQTFTALRGPSLAQAETFQISESSPPCFRLDMSAQA